MAEKQTNKERLKEITDSIETGIKELFQSENYARYLQTMSRFHRYSVNNQVLIHMQKPDATLVAGFNRWKDQFGRNVIKGEHGIKIIAPTPFKKKIEQEKLDPDTKLPMLDEDGKIITEEKTVQIPMYKPVTVFDVSQTEGKPLPRLAHDLVGNVENYEMFMEALKRSSPVPVSVEAMAGNMDGFFSQTDQRIAIREGMSEVQTVSALIHEMAHAMLHNNKSVPTLDDTEEYEGIELFDRPALFSNGRVDRDTLPDGLYAYDLRGSDSDPGWPVMVENHVVVNHAGTVITAEPLDLGGMGWLPLGDGMNFTGDGATIKRFYEQAFPQKAKLSRNTEEVQAESISFAVCAYYGIATGENSFGYIASWSKDKTLPELKESLSVISKTADGLINSIDRSYEEIRKERETALIDEEPAMAAERLYTVGNDKYLHVQRIDTGVDYTIYDKATLKEIDGGQLDMEFGTLAEAALEISTFPEAGGTGMPAVADIAILDEIQAAQEAALAIDPPVEEAPEQSADSVPDPAISVEARNAYGYTDAAMLPLTRDRAMELFERDVPVYLLYGDNTEGMAFEREDVLSHDGIFGVDSSDWEAVKADFSIAATNKWQDSFQQNTADSYCIYQLKDDDALLNLRFMNSAYLAEHGLEPFFGNYSAVYAGNLEPGADAAEQLDSLYSRFNLDHPQDFTGHSLSVSDILVIRQQGAVSCYYVDSVGFTQLPAFLPENYLKNAEMAMEDDYGMIDGIINNGKKEEPEVKAKSPDLGALFEAAQSMAQEPPSRDAEKKPSVLAMLHNPTPPRNEKTAQTKSAERDLI